MPAFDIEEEVRKAVDAGQNIRISTWRQDFMGMSGEMLRITIIDGDDVKQIQEMVSDRDLASSVGELRMMVWQRMWNTIQDQVEQKRPNLKKEAG